VRVGFVSAHFRRHSICKLFCGIMTGLDREHFAVYVFSSLQENFEDETTRAVAAHPCVAEFVRIGMTLVANRREVTDRRIDVLVSWSVGVSVVLYDS
jgi:predicted O-linked N-acetylglucosamine transferase (SPINDLY family)